MLYLHAKIHYNLSYIMRKLIYKAARGGQRNITEGEMLTLHIFNLVLIPGTLHGPSVPTQELYKD